MASGLTFVSVGCALGAVALLGRWSTRRTDALGRPRDLPVAGVSVLVLLAVVAAVPGARSRLEERRLARVASVLAEAPVKVHCQTGTAAFVDAGAELGYVRYGADGTPEHATLIKREQCRRLQEYLSGSHASPTLDQVVAIHVLTHEAMHMRGETDEAVAECEAMQRDALTARRLGASEQQARRVAHRYWTVVYPRMPDDYVTTDCAPGGRLDERLPDPPWGLSAAAP